MTGKRLRRVGSQFLRPAAQHVLADVEIPRRLSDAHPAFPNQPNRFDLELPAKYPPRHNPTSSFMKHLFSVSTKPAAGQGARTWRRRDYRLEFHIDDVK